ncbi:MAG: alkaline phosphatase [Nitrospiraceae bacterium]
MVHCGQLFSLRGGLAAGLFVLFASCAPVYKEGLPPGSPFTEEEAPIGPFVQGLASGDITDQTAVIWTRTNGPRIIQAEWWDEAGTATDGTVSGRAQAKAPPPAEASQASALRATSAADDYTVKVKISGLRPATRYRYRFWAAAVDEAASFGNAAKPSEEGTFRTAPTVTEHSPIRLLWSADLGGQGRCRTGQDEYPIFDRMRNQQAEAMLFVGDTVYGDEVCGAPPNVAGSSFAAETVDQYRAKHRYQRGASSLRRFLSETPVLVTWDDHEVRNNFSGPYDSQMPAGRQALLDYWPIGTPQDDPTRLYRGFRYGADVELFILDTRQYRSRNSDPDGPGKTMLGANQRDWLLRGLAESTATWKVIVTSVPLSNNRKGGTISAPGHDSWARANDGTGFEYELSLIVETILSRDIRNVVWLAADVHYVQANAYDPSGDGVPDFHEFIAGPLSANPARPVTPAPTFRPTNLFSDSGYFNFGLVTADRQRFQVQIADEEGTVRHTHQVAAR